MVVFLKYEPLPVDSPVYYSFKISLSQDFIVLKNNSKVVQTWFKGQPINFQLKNQMWVSALIYKIQDDSLYLQPYSTPTVLNAYGMPVTDTVFYGLMHVSVHSIKAFPKTSQSYSYIKNGLIFQLGGGGYFLLNLINTLSNNDPYFSGKNLFFCLDAYCAAFISQIISLVKNTMLNMSHQNNCIVFSGCNVQQKQFSCSKGISPRF